LANVIAISGNINYGLALKSDGTVVGWGQVPAFPAGLGTVKNIAAGEDHALALLANGTVVAWGGDASGQIDVPQGLSSVGAIAAGWNYSVGLVVNGPVNSFVITNPRLSSSGFSVAVATQSGKFYALEYKSSLDSSNWTALSPVTGNGGLVTLTDASVAGDARFYRVVQQ
jgi:alpha-tubulin suppressor-like RCC1 family protein